MKRGVIAVVIALLGWTGVGSTGQQPSVAVIQTRDRTEVALEAARKEIDAKVLQTLPVTGAQVWQIDADEAAQLNKMLAAGTLTHLEIAPGRIVPAIPPASVAPTTLTPLQQTRLQTLIGNLPGPEYRISASRPVNLSAELLRSDLNSGVVQIDLLNGEFKLFRRVGEVSTRGGEDFTWHGAMLGSRGDATLLVEPDGITGVVVVDGESYSITPVGEGQHVVTRSPRDGQLPDHPRDAKPSKPPGGADVALCHAATDEAADVLVLYTPKAKQVFPSVVDKEPKFGVDSMMLAFQSSDTNARIRLVDIREVNYVETLDMVADVNSISTLPEALQAKKSTGADLVVTYLGSGTACGWAKTIGADRSPLDAFAVVLVPTEPECPRGRYAFAHELGHLYGLRHETDFERPFEFGHAFGLPGDASDVMGTDSICNKCPRVPLLSNPKVLRNGKPFGKADCCDNARVIREISGKVVPKLSCRK